MKKRRKILLIIGIVLILTAVILAVAFEKALNSVLPPEMVKQLLNDEVAKEELSKLIKDENVVKDVQDVVYDQAQLKESDGQTKIGDIKTANGSNAYAPEGLPREKEGLSNTKSISDNQQENVNQNIQRNSKHDSSSSKQQNLSISPADQLEAAKIILSVMSVSEIKELISLYKSGKKSEAVQKGIGILKQRLSKEQKDKLKRLYFKYR